MGDALEDDQMLTAEQVAPYLGISPRTVYTLNIPHYRYGRSVRYSLKDVLEFKESCRLASTRAVSGSSLTASSPDGKSELLNYFQKHGLAPKQTATTSKKRPGSSPKLMVIENKTRK